jgi:hypothetical protein
VTGPTGEEQRLIAEWHEAVSQVFGKALSLDGDYPRDEPWPAEARHQLNAAIDEWRKADAAIYRADAPPAEGDE